jgi:hypothetical protein
MTKTPFVWLGAGRAQKRGVSRSGVLLDTLAKAGLPVPQGAILLDELLQIFLSEGVVEQLGDQIIVPDAVWLHEVLYRDVRFPRLEKTAVLSPILPDSYGSVPARPEIRGIDITDAENLSLGLQKVWSWPSDTSEMRRDVLLLSEVESRVLGRARLEDGAGKDIITVFQAGDHDNFALPRLGRWRRPSTEAPQFVRRLQMLVRGVRRTLGDGRWEIDWIDDGAICWAVGVSLPGPSN